MAGVRRATWKSVEVKSVEVESFSLLFGRNLLIRTDTWTL
jgi:hypothetical protein